MDAQILKNNLDYLIKCHEGISVLELAKKTNIPQPTLHHILCGETKKPRAQALSALANFFSISIDQLVGFSPLPNIPYAVQEKLKISSVPIIEWERLKEWPDIQTFTGKQLLLNKKIDKHSFALQLNHNLFEPLFPEKSILIFDAGKKPRDRDFVVAYLAATQSFMMNRLFIKTPKIFIKADNKDNTQLHEFHVATDKILATLMEVRMEF